MYKLIISFSLLLMLAVIPLPCYSVSMEAYLEAISSDVPDVLAYENGMSEMVMAFNGQLEHQGKPPLFCLPDKVEMSRVLIREITVKGWEAQKQEYKNKNKSASPAFFTIFILPYVYPCE